MATKDDSTDSQCEAIARHLKSGKSLTALEALQKFSCLRLAGRIYELKQRGLKILSYPAKVGRGKRISAYYLLRS